MSSGADLFVVCKQCGSEVSPYITECPYCGHRLRRRAPKLPRVSAPSRPRRGLARRLSGRRHSLSAGALSRPRRSLTDWTQAARAGSRPYATITLVGVSCAAWVAFHAEGAWFAKTAIIGPLHGDWWRLFTGPFAYGSGLDAFVTLVTVAIFGWLLEQRFGPVVVLALFLAAGATGALVASAVYADPIATGGGAGALALLVAWAAPDVKAARAGDYYEGDLLAVAAIAALLLAMPFAQPYQASWLATVTGGVLGLVLGLGLDRGQGPER